MRALSIVMNQEGLCDCTNLLKCLRMEDLGTFLVIGSIEPFDKRIFIRSMGRADIGLDAYAEQKTDQRGGKIASRGSPDEAWIAIKCHLMRAAICLQKAQHRFQNGLRMEIGADLSIEQDRCTGIDEIEDLNHMLLLPRRVGWNARNTFEVHLNFFKRSGTLDRLMFARFFLSNTIVLP